MGLICHLKTLTKPASPSSGDRKKEKVYIKSANYIQKTMLVRKRNGTNEPVSRTKIQKFLRHAGKTPPKLVDTIVKGMPRQISSEHLNAYFANTVQAAGHGLTAGRIHTLQLHKETTNSFTQAMLSIPLDPIFQEKINFMESILFITGYGKMK